MAIILADQSMPEMSGMQFLQKAKSRFPDTIRILLVGYEKGAEELQDMPEGLVFGSVKKPWHPEELKAVLVEAAEKYKAAKGF